METNNSTDVIEILDSDDGEVGAPHQLMCISITDQGPTLQTTPFPAKSLKMSSYSVSPKVGFPAVQREIFFIYYFVEIRLA
jgi:hypothetical protein